MIRSFVFLGLAALALGACDRGAGDAAQETAATGAQSEAAAEGSGPPPQLPGQVVRAFAGTELPALTFEDTEGRSLDLAAMEQPVLVNLWATWCAPCVVEMPALDNLAGAMEGRMKVLTISQDRRTELVPDFFAARDFRYLEQWLDPQNKLALAFTDGGLLPVTILFDAEGREILRVAGGYEWDSEEAIALVSEALEEADSAS
ncbi:MAG: TlpA family protein disulfide reductase [Erythrobacter sp.]